MPYITSALLLLVSVASSKCRPHQAESPAIQAVQSTVLPHGLAITLQPRTGAPAWVILEWPVGFTRVSFAVDYPLPQTDPLPGTVTLLIMPPGSTNTSDIVKDSLQYVLSAANQSIWVEGRTFLLNQGRVVVARLPRARSGPAAYQLHATDALSYVSPANREIVTTLLRQ